MKNRIAFIIIMLAISFTVKAQQSEDRIPQGEVTKSLYGIQIGVNGIYVHNEFRLGATASLKLEGGFGFKGRYSSSLARTELFLLPEFSAEARHYYNFDRRLKKEKSIYKNSGNFLSLLVNTRTDREFSNVVETSTSHQEYGIYARWGIKRTFGKHFTLETAIGPGFSRTKEGDTTYWQNDLSGMFRIGYTF